MKRRIADGKFPRELPFSRSDFVIEIRSRAVDRPMSLSGVQPKSSIRLERGKVSLPSPGRYATHMLKFIPKEEGFLLENDIPANEHLTMQIAETCFGIRTAAHALCFFSDGEPVYSTRRFDRDAQGCPLCQEDFCQLLDAAKELKPEAVSRSKYEGSYEEMGDFIRTRSCAPIPDCLEFFRRVVFNLLFANADAHKKNFSFLEYEPGDYRLSPAYDLLCTDLHVKPDDRLALDLFKDGFETPFYSDNGFYGRPDLTLFGERLALPSGAIEAVLKQYPLQRDAVCRLIEASALSPEAKRKYRTIFLDRLTIISG